MSENNKSIQKRYSREIDEIKNKLEDLKKGRIYEISHAKMDGYLATNAEQILKQFNELLVSIDNDLPSINEQLHEAFKDRK